MDMCIKNDRGRDWAGLPDVLLRKIIERLSLIDSVSFSNVCMSFRCVAADLFSDKRSSSAALPWLLMSGENKTKIRTCFSILERKVVYLEMPNSCGRYIWGSFEHWLVMVTPSNEKHQISLLNPFLGNQVILPNVLTRFHYSQLLASGSPYDPSTIYMLVGSLTTDLALWTQGCKDWCEYGSSCYMSRLGVFCNGYFYIMEDESCNIRRFEANSASCAIRMDNNTAGMTSEFYKLGMPDRSLSTNYWIGYLVESCGEVLFVARLFKIVRKNLVPKHFFTCKFEVYRLDLCKPTWIRVDDLGDRVLFIGHKCSRSASAKEIGAEMGSCIFFTDEYINVEARHEWSTDWKTSNDQRVKGSNIDDWGCYKLGPASASGDISYPSTRTNWNSTWISAPLWWYGLICPTL